MTTTSPEARSLTPDRRPGDTGSPGRARRRATVVLAIIGAAWVLVVAAYAAHAAVVLPVLLLVAVASLLRGGRTLLDRLMLAVGLLIGLTCAAGLIFAIWPWGLSPTAVAGVAFTALIIVAGLMKRRPALPRPRVEDVMAVIGGGVVAAFVAWPLAVNGHHPLNLVLDGEDNARHVSVFDAIRQTGGYLFQDWAAARQHVYDGMITYPQGSHMLDAVLDGFLRSGTHSYGSGTSALNHYVGFEILWYGFLALSMVWAAQWLAVGGLTLGRRIALVGIIVGSCAATELFTLVVLGYSSEVAGLAEMVLLTAVLARPVPRVGQQLVTMASLLVAVAFTYYLFLPAAGLAIVVWLVRHHRQVWRHRIVLFVSATVAGGLAALPPAIGLTVGNQGVALQQTGLHPPYRLLAAAGGAVLVGLLGRRARRSRTWPSYAWTLLSVVAVAVLLVVGQRAAGLRDGYYANKIQHLLIVVLIVGLCSLTLYLPGPRRRQPRVRTVASAFAGALVAVLALAGFGLLHGDSPSQPPVSTVWARGYRATAGNAASANAIMAEYDARVGQPTVATIMLDDNAYQAYLRTLYLSMLERTSGTLAPGFYAVAVDAPNRLDLMVTAVDGPVRIVVDSDQTLAAANAVKSRYPDRQIEVVRVSG